MVVDIERAAETVFLTTRPAYQQTSVYSLVEVDGQRRHKLEVQLQPTLKPVKFSDSVFLLLNNSRRRFRSRTFYQPSMSHRSFADTTFTSPKTIQERFVSSLDFHSDQQKRKFKTTIEIKPRTFKSSVSYPNVESLSSTSNRLPNGHDYNSINGDDVDENMNRRLPVFQEKYDPGASQVFIPRRKDYNFNTCPSQALLDSIQGSVLVDYSGYGDCDAKSRGINDLCNEYANMNGVVSNGISDL